jgi:hypothetical protein
MVMSTEIAALKAETWHKIVVGKPLMKSPFQTPGTDDITDLAQTRFQVTGLVQLVQESVH